MLNLGCTEALNFDGGGSSTLYVKELGVVNTPSEGSLRAVKNGLFITTPVTEDKVIAEIRFADYAKKVERNSYYSPVIYGYNAQGVLIDTNVKGIMLSCSAKLGKVQENGSTVLCNGTGTQLLTASLDELTSTILVTVESSGTGITSIADGDKDVNIYPNPIRTGEQAHINFNGSAKINIYNATGQLVNSFNCENSEDAAVTLPTESLSPGFYMISISGETSNKIAKLLIQ